MNGKNGLISGAARRNAFATLTREERMKYEIARELGLLERVRDVGWAGLRLDTCCSNHPFPALTDRLSWPLASPVPRRPLHPSLRTPPWHPPHPSHMQLEID